MACRGYAAYALAFVSEDEPERAQAILGRARDYGMRLLARKPRLRALLHASLEDLPGLLARCRKKDVPYLFWATFAWGYWINFSRDEPDALAELPRVQKMMHRVLALDENYYYGGPHLFFGIIHGTRTRALGGNPALSGKHFARSFEISRGRFLLGYYYQARYLAVQTQDKKLFVESLNKVIDAPSNPAPDLNLLNAVARQKAEILLEQVDEFF